MYDVDPIYGAQDQSDAVSPAVDTSPPSVPAPQPAPAQVLPADAEAERLLIDLCGIKKPALKDWQLTAKAAVDE